MRSTKFSVLASILSWHLCMAQTMPTTPSAIYNGSVATEDDPVLIRVGTGGAGQSGMLGALANAFISESVTNGTDPFRIAWYTTDTFYSIQMLGQGLVDAAITYSEVAEQIAIDQGQAVDPSYYLWRDHFLLVGPTTNPANLSQEDDIAAQFTDLLVAAQNTSNTTPTRFLTRYDKSATNAKESQQWINIGQTPWSTAYSTWYHQYIGFPIQALTAAIRLGEYTLTDRGTLLTLDPELTEQIDTFKAATDDLCDPLLNPAHMLVGAQAQDPELATAFAEWAIGPNGQEVIRTFERQGEALYTVAPSQEEVEAFEENGCNDAGVSATARRLRRRKLAKA